MENSPVCRAKQFIGSMAMTADHEKATRESPAGHRRRADPAAAGSETDHDDQDSGRR